MSSRPALVVIDDPLAATPAAPAGPLERGPRSAPAASSSKPHTPAGEQPAQATRPASAPVAAVAGPATVFARVPAELAERLEAAAQGLSPRWGRVTRAELVAALLWRHVGPGELEQLGELLDAYRAALSSRSAPS